MNIAMVDLLVQSPFYDRYLAQAVAPLVNNFTLYAPRFPHEPDCFSSAAFTRTPGLTDKIGLTFSRVRSLRKPMRLLEYYFNWHTLLRRFRANPPHVVHIQWLPLLGTALAFMEMRFVRCLRSSMIPVVYTVHNYRPHERAASDANTYHRLYLNVDRLIVHTQADRQKLSADGIAEKQIAVIPHGPLFSDKFGTPSSQARRSLGIDEKAIVLLMAGVIRPYKGIEELIRALPRVIDKHPETTVSIVGNAIDGKYAHFLQSLAADTNVQHHIQWSVGYVSSARIGLVHAAADAVLFPYRDISQSGAFLTAAGLGKCTITTRVGGLKELVRDGENGLQIDSAEPEAIADGLLRCLDLTSEQRAGLGATLRREVDQSCGWDLIARRTVALYRDIAN
jgi:glycosyltransferase involved in cell wall biosynthesis